MFQDRSAEVFQTKVARAYQDKFRGKSVNLFQFRNAVLLGASSAEMFPSKCAAVFLISSAGMFPSRFVVKYLDSSASRSLDSNAKLLSLPMEENKIHLSEEIIIHRQGVFSSLNMFNL